MLEPGSLVLQRYQIVRLIGRGGMGAVYEAIDTRLRNTVALKQMLGQSDENASAFEREAQLLAGLRYPALPKVIDYFRADVGRFLVMEFFSGADLAALHARRGGPFPTADVLDWADQLLGALIYLHSRQPPVLHRDIKPQNMKLTPDGQVVLLDFGLAKGAAHDGETPSFFGYTLQYAPLEQIDGSGTEPRSDLYALAATLYHLLSERPPPNAPQRADAILAGRADPLRPLYLINPTVSPEVSTVLQSALALLREERPASAVVLREQLRDAGLTDAHTQIGRPQPVRRTAPLEQIATPVERPISVAWEQVRQAAQTQFEPVLRELAGTPRRPGAYLPDTYVARGDAESELANFLASRSGALVLIGDVGVGKTCLLARWAADQAQQGDAVLFYRCGGSLGPEIDREIARDLGRELPDLLLHDLGQIANLAAGANQRLIIVFDALNEYRSGAAAGPEALLKQIDALAGRVAGAHLRLVISCNSATWGQLDRAGATKLFWSAYHHTAAGEATLTLTPFANNELNLAYTRYQAVFDLRTPFERLPAALHERLRRPLLLRMVAESYRAGPVQLAASGLNLGIFRRFYDERVRQRREQLFMDEFAAECLRRGQAAVPVRELARNDQLRAELLSDEPDSAYVRLLDGGVLRELGGDLFTGEMVSFAYGEVGAYVLARYLLRDAGAGASAALLVRDLIERSRSFPLAWDIARTLLLIARRPDDFATLASSPAVELRELVVQCLAELHTDDADSATEVIKQLLQQTGEEARRTGLKAAYYIGPPARPIFLWAASRGTPVLRRATRDVLYLTWRHDPHFTYGLLRDLVARVGPGALRDLRNMLEFFFELSVTIYINHCERPDVRDTTVEIYYELAKQRLHLDVINTGFLGKTIEDLIFQAVANAFSQPILDTMMLAEVVPVESFFALPHEERELLVQVAPLFDPATPLAPRRHELLTLLSHPNTFFNLVGAAHLGIHAVNDLDSAAPIIQSLFAELPGPGRLWILLSLNVLLPNTPPAWATLAEQFTERLFVEHPDLINGTTPSLLQALDLLLLPLGLAYGKIGQTMPMIELLVQDALLRGDDQQLDRITAGLAAVGFYYPQPTLTILGQIVEATSDALPAALTTTLATMRMLHLDAVDVFMAQAGLSATLQRQVAAAADSELVRRYIYWLGLYNQVVHSCVYYPKMRQQMAMGAMEMLARARTPPDFIAAYTATVFRMLREAGFRLSEWTT
jgi:hypothetical protein